jgi:hypothetical protein
MSYVHHYTRKLHSRAVVFKFFCLRTPRCNFPSTFTPKVVGVEFKLYTVYGLRLRYIQINVLNNNRQKIDSVALVLERIIPTERPSLVGEYNANFLRIEGVAWSAQRIPMAVFSIFLTAAITFSSK